MRSAGAKPANNPRERAILQAAEAIRLFGQDIAEIEIQRAKILQAFMTDLDRIVRTLSAPK